MEKKPVPLSNFQDDLALDEVISILKGYIWL